ncbi:hypothetical protein ASG85_15365 [Paenibacillus sp. Soil724D2]|nr:hypothetical protein ASG85_15365 [Paenibacillus sp. Soil724D2]
MHDGEVIQFEVNISTSKLNCMLDILNTSTTSKHNLSFYFQEEASKPLSLLASCLSFNIAGYTIDNDEGVGIGRKMIAV